MKRKCLAVGIILLFVGTGIIPAIAQNTEKPLPTSRGDWLYVGGIGPGNYTTIQGAINDANDGDTVFVYDDLSPYYEHVIINRSIILTGENKNTTIIDGSRNGDVVLFTKNASNVTVSGFTLQNSGGNYSAGILPYSGYNVITGNIIRNTTYGIFLGGPLSSSISNIIAYNTLINNSYSIVIWYNSFRNKVYENYITGSQYSIFLWGLCVTAKEETRLSDEEYQNDIYRNRITNNGEGIYIQNFFYTNIFENTITNNSVGIDLTATYMCACRYNNIEQNTINSNEYGIFIQVYSGGIVSNNLSKNNISYNDKGIYITVDSDGRVINNTIFHNNFIENNQTVYFEYSLFNHWIGNFWGKARLLPYPIFGKLSKWRFSIPWVNFDWHPAREPYDIPGVR
jgi:parallel beta-helix repeat protein